ncbi:MAG: acetoacetate--CoA ligase [Alphaproteobacteria bacterium]|nr:acetoacetate--CoA ligase [Alphaproteobacteria bacterium]
MIEPLWTPTSEQIETAKITELRRAVSAQWQVDVPDSTALWRFSVDEREKFWRTIIDFCDLKGETWGERDSVDVDKLPGAKWFPDARFNFAENLLKRRDDGEALVFWGEDKVRRRMTFAELYDAVSQLAQALHTEGVEPGDRVAGYLPNMPEAIISMLAAASLGATWSSCSPDFGLQGVLDRFGQIEPKVLIACDGYFYNGKTHDIRKKTADLVSEVPSIQRVVIVPYASTEPDISGIRDAVDLTDFVGNFTPADIQFAQMPFSHPLYILYSSGTTGQPKCIVHEAGGMLLKHTVEQVAQFSIGPDSRVFWFTTLGWMMWNWLASNLAWGATLLLYDGSPFYPDGNVLWDFAAQERMTLFGTSAKYIDACNKAGLKPMDTHDLSSLRSIGSTGSTLVPEGFDYVYKSIKSDVHLASMSGGTDIGGCFCGGDETLPVWRGEIQAAILGMATDVFDDDGNSVAGVKGELVCTKAFPAVPSFLNDVDGARIHDAYFARFPNVWTHGDFIERTEHGGFIIYGRSDATLNPGGVRIGTAEIYRQVEKLDEVLEGIVIGQEWDNDVRVVLFIVLRKGLTLDDALTDKIKKQVRANCTPRHVPARVVQVPDIPRTKSGKITELAVRDVVHGHAIKNAEALANPEALAHFKDRPELFR